MGSSNKCVTKAIEAARRKYVNRRLQILDDMGIPRPDATLMKRLLDVRVTSEVSVDNLFRSHIDVYVNRWYA